MPNAFMFSRITFRQLAVLTVAGFAGVFMADSRPAKAGEASAHEAALTELQIHAQPAASKSEGDGMHFRGGDERQQLLVTAKFSDGKVRDYTKKVTYLAANARVVDVGAGGVVSARSDGATTITVRSPEGISASTGVTVENSKLVPPINFPNQIVPIFTKLGCNAGGCHGKSSGQNGFRLSLLGFEPTEDYEHLTREARGRRLFPAAPAQSLLLLKATATLPHGGGHRLDVDSDDYKKLYRWIAQGMPYGKTNDPTVARIEVYPDQRTLQRNDEQQLAVTAYYTDGSTEDVTCSALYEPNDKEMAKAEATGLVKVFEQPGDVAVMIRYQAKVAVFRATVPLGAPVGALPAPRNFVDELVFKKLQALGLPPSGDCDDATFLRRACVDIAGRLPTPDEAQRFLADTNPAKRDRWVDSLLEGTDYADYFANKWSLLLRNRRTTGMQARGSFAFHEWIRDSLMANKPYDQFVREILTASGDVTHAPPVVWYRQVRDPSAELEDCAQLFLGMRLQCAQCHHHPFEKWSQQDYYSFSAFFSRVGRKNGSQPGEEVIFHRRGSAQALNKKTKQNVKPAGLGGPILDIPNDEDPREALVDWMAAKDNRFFARAFVNRYWKHFFNRGLVDPEDDMRETNPASNPELLDALAQHFVASRFDMKDLIRTICQSRVYQLSSTPNQYNAQDKQNFSRYYPKRLGAEVLYDALDTVTRSQGHFEGVPVDLRAVQLPDNSFNEKSYFLTVFGRPDASSACECERSGDASLAQCLHLLNSKEVAEKLTSDSGEAALLAEDKTEPDEKKIRDLYYLAFSRGPAPEELSFARSFVEKKAKSAKEAKDVPTVRRQAYEDMIWALVNTKEFLFNH